MNKAQTVAEIICRNLELTDPEWIRGIEGALSSRSGTLLATRPTDEMAKAAWLGLQPNPWKISIPAVIMLEPDARKMFDHLSQFNWPVELDKDAHTLKQLGVWP